MGQGAGMEPVMLYMGSLVLMVLVWLGVNAARVHRQDKERSERAQKIGR